MLILATPDELATWMGSPAPDDAAVLLREASSRVSDACQCDIYDTQSNGKPSDPDLVEAMMEATCAQAELWSLTGVNPAAGAGGLASQVVSSSIDGASLNTNAATLDSAKAESIDGLGASALRILRLVGLASNSVKSS